MNRMLLAVLSAGLLVAAGCEDKKAPEAPKVGDAMKDAGKSMGDAAKKAADSAKDAGAKAADAAKDAGAKAADAAKATADKAKDMASAAGDTMKKEVMGMVDKAKGQLDQLTKGASTVAADKKPELDKAITDLSGQFKGVQDMVSKLGSASGDGLMKSLGEIKTAGTKLIDGIKAAADKAGIKLN